MLEITEDVINYVNQLFSEKFPELTVLHIASAAFGVKVYVEGLKRKCINDDRQA